MKSADWIPVTERLPEEGQEVLTLIHDAYIQTVCLFRVENGVNIFESEETGADINSKYDDPVTHWQPLPGDPL